MGAEGDVARGLRNAQAMRGLEPLPRLVHERDERDRHAEDRRGELHQVVEGVLARRVEYRQRAQLGEAGGLVGRQSWVDHRDFHAHGVRAKSQG